MQKANEMAPVMSKKIILKNIHLIVAKIIHRKKDLKIKEGLILYRSKQK